MARRSTHIVRGMISKRGVAQYPRDTDVATALTTRLSEDVASPKARPIERAASHSTSLRAGARVADGSGFPFDLTDGQGGALRRQGVGGRAIRGGED